MTAAGSPAGAAASELFERIRGLLAPLRPLRLEIDDQSAAHAGHAGARAGAHLSLLIVSAGFEGLSRVQRHRLVYERLDPLLRGSIHALALRLLSPQEDERARAP